EPADRHDDVRLRDDFDRDPLGSDLEVGFAFLISHKPESFSMTQTSYGPKVHSSTKETVLSTQYPVPRQKALRRPLVGLAPEVAGPSLQRRQQPETTGATTTARSAETPWHGLGI